MEQNSETEATRLDPIKQFWSNAGLKILLVDLGLKTLLVHIGAIISTIFAMVPKETPDWVIVVGILYCVIVFGAMVHDTYQQIRRLPNRYDPNNPKIKKFLREFLNSGQNAAIVTRDLSWAKSGSEEFTLLEKKAREGELEVFCKVDAAPIDALRKAGAQVHSYPGDFLPESRFTIIDYRKSGSRLAVGLVVEGKHTIFEYSDTDVPIFALAKDLVALCEAKTGISNGANASASSN